MKPPAPAKPPPLPARPPPLPPLPDAATAGIVAIPRPLALKRRPAHASNFSAHARLAPTPTLIVLHCTDGCEGTCKDDDVAAMFADPNLSPHRSAHYVIDADSCTRCVPDLMTAWHSGHHGNTIGIGIEFCGRASQSRAEWLDALSLPMLCIGARLISDLCRQYQIPPVVVNAGMLLAGQGGITTHSFVSSAWKESTHNDPGAGFPLGSLVMAVRQDLLLVG